MSKVTIGSASIPPNSAPGVKNAFQVAQGYLGWRADHLRNANNAVGKDMTDNLSADICCANFVSACLQDAGQISARQHNNSVAGLLQNLKNDPNWKETSLRDAKPGDMVTFADGSDPTAHTEMFAGWKDGKVGGIPLFIGSNNVNKDGTQSVTQGTCGMRLTHVMHFIGGPEVEGAVAAAGGGSNSGGAYANGYDSGYVPPSAPPADTYTQLLKQLNAKDDAASHQTMQKYFPQLSAQQQQQLAQALQSNPGLAKTLEKNPKLATYIQTHPETLPALTSSDPAIAARALKQAGVSTGYEPSTKTAAPVSLNAEPARPAAVTTNSALLGAVSSGRNVPVHV